MRCIIKCCEWNGRVCVCVCVCVSPPPRDDCRMFLFEKMRGSKLPFALDSCPVCTHQSSTLDTKKNPRRLNISLPCFLSRVCVCAAVDDLNCSLGSHSSNGWTCFPPLLLFSFFFLISLISLPIRESENVSIKKER
jgi:hypothetical protein